LLLPEAGLGPQSFYLHLPSSWDYIPSPPYLAQYFLFKDKKPKAQREVIC
jgi:hypothetical protein